MSRAGILYSQVATAASALAQSGTYPTVDAVRAALGNTGSKSTIAPFLKQWREANQGGVAPAETGLPADIVASIKGLYDRVQSIAQAKVDEMRQDLDEHILRADQAHETSREIKKKMGIEIEALQQSLADSQNLVAATQANLQSKNIELAALQSESSSLVQRLEDRAQEIKQLVDQIDQGRRQFEHFQEQAAEQRKTERASLTSKIGSLENEVATARGYAQQMREELAVAVAAKEDLHIRLSELSASKKEMAENLRLAEEQVSSLKEELSNTKLAAEREAHQNTIIALEKSQLETKITQQDLEVLRLKSALDQFAIGMAKDNHDQRKPGDLVLATKSSDGEAAGRWDVGAYVGEDESGFSIRLESSGAVAAGFRAVAGIGADVGKWLIEHGDALSAAPTEYSISLWQLLSIIPTRHGHTSK